MKVALLLLVGLSGLVACSRQSEIRPSDRRWFARLCEDLDRAPDERRPVADGITVGEYRFGQAMWGHCPPAAADAVARGLWRERDTPEGERFRFWFRMPRGISDSVIFNAALRVFADAGAPALARAAGFRVASQMSREALSQGTRSGYVHFPDLRPNCLTAVRVDTVYRSSHDDGPRVIRPLAQNHSRQVDSARTRVGADQTAPADLRRWLGFC